MPKTDQVLAPDSEDANMLTGGPGPYIPDEEDNSDEHDSSQQTVKINGVEYTVDAELAAALEERESSFQRKLNENSDELGRLRSQAYRPQDNSHKDVKVVQQDELDGLDVLLFENPKEAIKRVEQNIINKVAAAYQANQGEQKFWSDFYRENPDLEDADVLAKSVLNSRMAEWHHLPVSEGRSKLAKAVKDEIAKFTGKQNANGRSPHRTHVESSNNAAPRQNKPAEPTAPRTLGQILAARKEARRTAATSGGKATA